MTVNAGSAAARNLATNYIFAKAVNIVCTIWTTLARDDPAVGMWYAVQ